METIGEKVRAARMAAGMSQGQLAREVGISQQAIMAIESGRVASSRALPKIAQALGMTAEDAGLPTVIIQQDRSPSPSPSVVPREFAPANVPHITFRELPRDVPVFGQVVGGEAGGDFEFNGQTIDYLRRPPGIAMMRDVFGLYVTGTSMYPRFEEGEPIYASASRPPAIGDDVVIELLSVSEGEPPAGFIKRLKRRTPTKIVCEQFNPPKEVEYERSHIKNIFRIIPLSELVGI